MILPRLRQVFIVLLNIHDSPERTALAFAIGVWIAFFPIIGAHTLLALLIAFAFRLNRVAILIGAYLNNPWTAAPMLMLGTAFGCLLTGVSPSVVWALEWEGSWSRGLYTHLRPLLLPYVVGNLALGSVLAVVAYVATRAVVRRHRSRAQGPTPVQGES